MRVGLENALVFRSGYRMQWWGLLECLGRLRGNLRGFASQLGPCSAGEGGIGVSQHVFPRLGDLRLGPLMMGRVGRWVLVHSSNHFVSIVCAGGLTGR